MAYIAKTTYEDNTVVEEKYRLRHILKYLKRMKNADSSIKDVKPLPVSSWLIKMTTENTDLKKVKSIEIREKVV